MSTAAWFYELSFRFHVSPRLPLIDNEFPASKLSAIFCLSTRHPAKLAWDRSSYYFIARNIICLGDVYAFVMLFFFAHAIPHVNPFLCWQKRISFAFAKPKRTAERRMADRGAT